MLKIRMPGFVYGALCVAPLLVSGARAADAPQPPATDSAPAAPKKSKPPAPAATAGSPADKSRSAAKDAPAHAHPSRYAPDRFAGRAGLYYSTIWGIDSINVKLVESGELVRFSYRILDPAKAKGLNDKQAEAKLEDPKAGVSLVVPTMEKIGQLRQTAAPEAGRSYWMTFSNKGRLVKRGDRVNVVVGQFRANNVVVD
jgi:hypothetical protein